MKNVLDSFKTQLGPPGEKIIIEDVDTEEDARLTKKFRRLEKKKKEPRRRLMF